MISLQLNLLFYPCDQNNTRTFDVHELTSKFIKALKGEGIY